MQEHETVKTYSVPALAGRWPPAVDAAEKDQPRLMDTVTLRQPLNTDEVAAGWVLAIGVAADSAERERLLKQAGLLGLPESMMEKIRAAAEDAEASDA